MWQYELHWFAARTFLSLNWGIGVYLTQWVWSSNSNCAFSCSLENCGITSDSCMEISAVLRNKSSLMDLSVGDNKIGDSGLALLCQGLMHPSCKIQKLW